MNLTYLAAPYSSDDMAVIAHRMNIFREKDAYLTINNVMTVSPLYKHFTVVGATYQPSTSNDTHFEKIPGDWNYWEQYSKVLLKQCSSMIIIQMEGWETSVGVLGEIEFCIENDIAVFGMNVETNQLTPMSVNRQ